MSKAIRPEDLKVLRPLEQELKKSVKAHNMKEAECAMEQIQVLLAPYGADHHRLLECRLWYFEALFDANHITVAESGFQGIVQRASNGSRLFIEGTLFLALCFLRQKRVNEAKLQFRIVIRNLNKISSPSTRNLLQKRILERIEEEAVLTSIIGVDEGPLKPDQIHEQAILLLQKPEGELLEVLTRALPYGSIKLLDEVRTDAFLLLTVSDRKLLPAPGQATQVPHVGQLVLAVLKRVAWKTLCDHKSPIFKLWSKKVSQVYSTAYFATSIAQTFNDWKIGMPFLAAGVAAVAMKYGAHEFCDISKPDSIMETRRHRESK